MKEKLKSLSLNLLLIFGIFFFALLIYLVYIAGPNRAYEKEDRQLIEAFEKSNNITNLTLENRFAFDDVTYIVSNSSRTTLYWFSRDLKNSGFETYQDFSPAQRWVDGQGLTATDISYGVYEDKLVYFIRTDRFDFIIDFETQDVVLRIGV
ncbi:hypothetical protein AOC36_04245 [Erysipelothrix larvae]|uniref:DUF5590 domain-containing protein n=1 Tax=Erysipelothrix larvae TaxID=1514105 RepID=A0A0X8GZP9_9FIRM|nr:hypothetical protein [Erysipelothrix larvae]AMC93209.1 hypothetical protein AOC36_04245 [Erysipelothrix larvae]